VVVPEEVLTGTNAQLFQPWIERAAATLSVSPQHVAYAVRQFIDGVPFADISLVSSIPLCQVLLLYRMPWRVAVSLVPPAVPLPSQAPPEASPLVVVGL
jgi:hypothetical protein